MPAFGFPPPSRAEELRNYIFRLVDYLQFLLSCLDEENLSESLRQALTDTGWRTLTLEDGTGFTAAEGGYPRVRRIGEQVYLDGAVTVPAENTSFSSTGTATVFALPKAYRPSRLEQTVCADKSGRLYLLIVGTDGAVTISGITEPTAEENEIHFFVSYFIQ